MLEARLKAVPFFTSLSRHELEFLAQSTDEVDVHTTGHARRPRPGLRRDPRALVRLTRASGDASSGFRAPAGREGSAR